MPYHFKSSIVLREFSLGFIFLLFIPVVSFSKQQSVEVVFNWENSRENNISEEITTRFLWFRDAFLSAGPQPMPFYSLQVNVPASSNHLQAELSAEEYVPLTSNEIKLIDEEFLKNNQGVIAGIAMERFKPYGVISLFPFKKDNSGQWQKLVSCTITYSTENRPVTRSSRSYVNSSVLSTGDWYKIGVTETGVYKITYNFLKDMGIDIDNTAPQSINIYGNSFGMLPELNSEYRPDDLAKISISIQGETDNVFNSEDYILFYAKGPHTWKYNTSGDNFYHTKHLYTDTAYYFIKIDPSETPQRVLPRNSVAASPTDIVTTFDGMGFVEPDQTNFIKSGREWYGDIYDYVTEKSYSFPLTNLDLSQPVEVNCNFIAKTPGSTSSSFNVSMVNGSGSANINIQGVGSGSYLPAARTGTATFTANPSTSNGVELKVTFNKGTAIAQGWLNFIEVFGRRQLIVVGNQMEYCDRYSTGAGKVAEFHVTSSLTDIITWEITDPLEAAMMQTDQNGNVFSFRIYSDSLRKFISFRPSSALLAPIKGGQVANQNLHGLPYADMLIVVPPVFLSEANRLAAFHTEEGLSVHVVTTYEIYNEFSSGMRDATAIKHFLRMFYYRAAGDPELLPKYLLLFGDGSYDNKNRLSGNTAFIPTYQSYESLSITTSFISDDYFVLLDDNENMNNSNKLDMGIGRLPVSTSNQAADAVNKIIAYSTNTGSLDANCTGCCNGVNSEFSMGDWRNIYALVADDEDANNYVYAAEYFADSLKDLHPIVNVEKIFLDAYLQQTTPGGERYADATDEILNRVQKGCLVFNYIGHGGEVGWAHERILNITTINNWSNNPRLPLFMTATCEFSRFDDPARTSAGEFIILNGDGGGIGLLTTTRLVYSGPNETLNKQFNRVVLERIDGKPKRLGDIFMETKNNTITQILTENTRNFTLLGDPAVKLRLPEFNVLTDSVNGIDISVEMDTIQALSKVTVHGHIADETGQTLSDFNGLVFPTVFDKEQTLYTLANDPGSYVMPFDLRKNIIYKGKATVTNGFFSFTFIVPKDINYDYGIGKLSYYAHNGSADANGYSFDIVVGGTNPDAASDDSPPQIDLYLNDEGFVNGGITDESPVMIAKVNDENGINTIGTGIGHDITAVLDDNTSNTIILNEYYEADVNTYQSGVVSYPFKDLTEGNHTLKFKIWDVYNNSSEANVEFVVAKTEALALEHVLNYPNPFTTRTQFYFEHNQACTNMTVQVQVFTVSGKLVKTIHQVVNSEGFRSEPIEWDGRDDFGDRLAIGTYIYRVKVETENGVVEKYEKLVILN